MFVSLSYDIMAPSHCKLVSSNLFNWKHLNMGHTCIGDRKTLIRKLFDTKASVMGTLSNSMLEMGVGVSLQFCQKIACWYGFAKVYSALVTGGTHRGTTPQSQLGDTTMGIAKFSAWVTGDTHRGATPQSQLWDTPMRIAPPAQPRSAQPYWLDWPNSTFPAGAVPTYPSHGTFTAWS